MAEAVDLLALAALVDRFRLGLLLFLVLFLLLLRGVTRVRLSRGHVDGVSRRWRRRDAVAASMASARCHVAATPSTWPLTLT